LYLFGLRLRIDHCEVDPHRFFHPAPGTFQLLARALRDAGGRTKAAGIPRTSERAETRGVGLRELGHRRIRVDPRLVETAGHLSPELVHLLRPPLL
jgi:hypothetical protein